MPSHGMMMMINDTAYNITGLNSDTYYNITMHLNNKNDDGEPTTVFVKTKLLPPGTYIAIFMCSVNYVPYSGNVWWGKSLANLVNEHNFAKLKPSKRHMHITKQWDCTPIR